MSPAVLIFLLFSLGLAIVFGASALDNLNDDTIWELRELAGVGILCFVFFGSIGVMLLFSLSDAICAFMEGLGDQALYSGNALGARRWYDRCLWLQDHLLNNVWRRSQIAGKHVATFQDLPGAAQSESQLPGSKAQENQRQPGPIDSKPKQPNIADGADSTDDKRSKRKFVVPPALANSVFFKYAVAILFTLVAIVHALDGTMTGALGILFVGIALNAYWLTINKDIVE